MDVKHVAKLANLPLTHTEEKKFASQFSDTLKTIAVVNELDTSRTPPTSQVTGLKNVTRADQVTPSRVLTQSQATSQAPASHQGYILVPAIFDGK